MATLSWGKCKIEKVESENGAPKETTPSGGGDPFVDWKEIDTPKEGTTQLTITAGDKTEAKEEGGAVVDVRYGKNSYTFEFTLFVKKGAKRPFVDVDGYIDGEWAFRVTPEDPDCTGFQIDKSTLRVEDSFTSADSYLLRYVAECLKPASGKIVKPYPDDTPTA